MGDDDDNADNARACDGLARLTASGVTVYALHGNRDFLLGEAFARRTGVKLLPDPVLVDLYGTPTLLSHGDVFCTEDFSYQELRSIVRKPGWQNRFLALPLAAGEIPVGLSAYSANMDSIKEKGGPVDWAAVEPLVGRPQGLAVAKNAPHPNAALLFADYVLSPEGMELLGAMGRVPTSKNVKTPLDTTKSIMLDVATVSQESDKWQKVWNELFLK